LRQPSDRSSARLPSPPLNHGGEFRLTIVAWNAPSVPRVRSSPHTMGRFPGALARHPPCGRWTHTSPHESSWCRRIAAIGRVR
jgi:hypothetical protein